MAINNSICKTLIKVIVEQQQTIIGPMAIEQANLVSGLKVSPDIHSIEFNRDGVQVLSDLVRQYETLFGQASVEACKESVRQILGGIDQNEVPIFLK